MFARFASKSADAGFTHGEALFPHASTCDASNESCIELTSPLRAAAGRFQSNPI